jgi:DnaK suppressor protein
MQPSSHEAEHWRKRLRDEEVRVLDRLGHDIENYEDTVDSMQNEADDAVAWAENEGSKKYLLGLSERERNALDAIHEAQQRLDRGEFGVCTNCGQEINPRRLESIPYTTFCIECEEVHEEGAS